ncbi:hypothetical protein H4Q32_016718 [Labeo rohita]|uniref:Retrotransposon gag domain-containing protein n=1 Tax=Labeo rohita TaxID=84645 RepID=A0ABQ8M8N5_LABRO|nr:hypothetical protein H4Q32_016718 [Labeo rohita]
MAEQASPHSTFVEMEVPEVATPNWPPVHRQAPQESYVPTVCQTPSQFIPIVRWQHSSSNLFTYDLPRTLPTPGREIGQLTAKHKLQSVIQQGIKAVQQHFQRDCGKLLKESSQLTLPTDELPTNMKELQTKMEAKFENQEKRMADLSEKSTLPKPLPVPSPVTSPVTHTAVKSDHIKLTFPMLGGPVDDPDPLLYITRCQDFLAVHPLTDMDILATFSTVLPVTAEDYEDELAECVRYRTQGEKESIRDFAFTYRVLCKRWKPSLTEADIVKMILKNIKPYLASHLRSHVTTVEELVQLGHQLMAQLDFMHQQPGQPSNNSITSTSAKNSQTIPDKSSSPLISGSTSTTSKNFVCVPQQLIIPVSVGSRKGKATVNTANGEAFGWLNVLVNLNDHMFTIPAAVLAFKALAYVAVLGLDFNFFSGLQINEIDKKYTFKSTPDVDYPFQPAHLPDDGKCQLLQVLEANSVVCTLRLGRTDVLMFSDIVCTQTPVKPV